MALKWIESDKRYLGTVKQVEPIESFVGYTDQETGEDFIGVFPGEEESWFIDWVDVYGLDYLCKRFPYQPLKVNKQTGILEVIDPNCEYMAKITNCFHIIYHVKKDHARNVALKKQQANGGNMMSAAMGVPKDQEVFLHPNAQAYGNDYGMEKIAQAYNELKDPEPVYMGDPTNSLVYKNDPYTYGVDNNKIPEYITVNNPPMGYHPNKDRYGRYMNENNVPNVPPPSYYTNQNNLPRYNNPYAGSMFGPNYKASNGYSMDRPTDVFQDARMKGWGEMFDAMAQKSMAQQSNPTMIDFSNPDALYNLQRPIDPYANNPYGYGGRNPNATFGAPIMPPNVVPVNSYNVPNVYGWNNNAYGGNMYGGFNIGAGYGNNRLIDPLKATEEDYELGILPKVSVSTVGKVMEEERNKKYEKREPYIGWAKRIKGCVVTTRTVINEKGEEVEERNYCTRDEAKKEAAMKYYEKLDKKKAQRKSSSHTKVYKQTSGVSINLGNMNGVFDEILDTINGEDHSTIFHCTKEEEAKINQLAEAISVYDLAVALVLMGSIDHISTTSFNLYKEWVEDKLQWYREQEIKNPNVDWRAPYRYRMDPPGNRLPNGEYVFLGVDNNVLPPIVRDANGNRIIEFDRGHDVDDIVTPEEFEIFYRKAEHDRDEIIRRKKMEKVANEGKTDSQIKKEEARYNPWDPMSRRMHELRQYQKMRRNQYDIFRMGIGNRMTDQEFNKWWYGIDNSRGAGSTNKPLTKRERIRQRMNELKYYTEQNIASLDRFRPIDYEAIGRAWDQAIIRRFREFDEGYIKKDDSLAQVFNKLGFLLMKIGDENIERQRKQDFDRMNMHRDLRYELHSLQSHDPSLMNINPNMHMKPLDPKWGLPEGTVDFTTADGYHDKRKQFVEYCRTHMGVSTPLKPVYK